MSDSKHIVLVVDDTPENIDLLSGMLRPDYKVKAATTGKTALKIANSTPQPDIILLDVMMPEMSGYEVCEMLKKDPKTSLIPIIFVTAKTAAEDEEQGLNLGAVDYITKPFNPAIVEARVRAHLAVYDQQKKLHRENALLKEQISGGFTDLSENDLEKLTESGEGDKLEFKSTLRHNLHTEKPDKRMENACLKTAAAYLNSNGGVLLVGVDDEGNSLGLAKDNFKSEDKLMLHWNNLIKTCLGAEFSQFISSSIRDLDNERIMVVQCLPTTRPVFFSRDNDEIFFIRAGNGTQHLKPSEILTYTGERIKETM